MKANSKPVAFVESVKMHETSGTSAEPNSTPVQMLMTSKGKWMLMFHGELFLNEIQQSGPRGAGKSFSTNWFMPMAQRKLGYGTLTLRTMLSLEPATITEERYPELFQQGETAYGRTIVDGQHPHNFFMEVAAIYDYQFSEKTAISFYAAPVGDPAQFFRLEASGFHGREPDKYRWDIDSGRIDSWSACATVNPGRNWSFQYSIGQLASPEALMPEESVRRMTASLTDNRPIHNGNWASMFLWGRNQSLEEGNIGNGYLLESTLGFNVRNHVWTRIEDVDRTNEWAGRACPRDSWNVASRGSKLTPPDTTARLSISGIFRLRLGLNGRGTVYPQSWRTPTVPTPLA